MFSGSNSSPTTLAGTSYFTLPTFENFLPDSDYMEREERQKFFVVCSLLVITFLFPFNLVITFFVAALAVNNVVKWCPNCCKHCQSLNLRDVVFDKMECETKNQLFFQDMQPDYELMSRIKSIESSGIIVTLLCTCAPTPFRRVLKHLLLNVSLLLNSVKFFRALADCNVLQ